MYSDWLSWMRKSLSNLLHECKKQVALLPDEEQKKLQPRLSSIRGMISQLHDSASYHYIFEEIIALQRYCRRRLRSQIASSFQPITTNSEEISEDIHQIQQVKYRPVPIGQHKLPPLRYSYDALEPHIDRETMRIHHSQLHQNYVNNLNKAELNLKRARESGNFDLIKHWQRELSFNGAGHYLHTIFFDGMSPGAGGDPKGLLREQIVRDFGSYQAFKQHFIQAAEKVEGGGWALLIWSPRAQRLEILQVEKHQNLSQQDQIPILALDVWEHAYYLKYPNKRKQYIENWFQVVDWKRASDRFQTARKVLWQPF